MPLEPPAHAAQARALDQPAPSRAGSIRVLAAVSSSRPLGARAEAASAMSVGSKPTLEVEVSAAISDENEKAVGLLVRSTDVISLAHVLAALAARRYHLMPAPPARCRSAADIAATTATARRRGGDERRRRRSSQRRAWRRGRRAAAAVMAAAAAATAAPPRPASVSAARARARSAPAWHPWRAVLFGQTARRHSSVASRCDAIPRTRARMSSRATAS